MKKAVITKVETKENSYIVSYESGAVRTYKADKLPKTVRSFLDEQNTDPFFKSKAARLIFFLTQADGEMRMNELGVNRKHYANKDYAKAWMTNLLKIVHPDNCNHPLAADATAEVNRIYKDMIR